MAEAAVYRAFAGGYLTYDDMTETLVIDGSPTQAGLDLAAAAPRMDA